MEIVGPSKRTFAGMAIEFVWCAGEALLLLMAYFVRNWRYLEIALSVPSIGLFFYWWSVLNCLYGCCLRTLLLLVVSTKQCAWLLS